VHVAVSLDGATTGFTPAVGLFYELAAMWDEDVTLTGPTRSRRRNRP
jgi:2,5-diamino-6-(ribosylamino)-4(3H)-pyrimidinone 5'-phosphate reductase